jgi:hypothetical protein
MIELVGNELLTNEKRELAILTYLTHLSFSPFSLFGSLASFFTDYSNKYVYKSNKTLSELPNTLKGFVK